MDTTGRASGSAGVCRVAVAVCDRFLVTTLNPAKPPYESGC